MGLVRKTADCKCGWITQWIDEEHSGHMPPCNKCGKRGIVHRYTDSIEEVKKQGKETKVAATWKPMEQPAALLLTIEKGDAT